MLRENVLAGVRIRKRASRVCAMYHCCGRVYFSSYPEGKCMDEVLGRVCLPSFSAVSCLAGTGYH